LLDVGLFWVYCKFQPCAAFEQRQIHALTGIDGGNGDILIVLHNPLHLDELHLRSRCNVLDIEPAKTEERACSFMDMTHAGRALAQPWLVLPTLSIQPSESRSPLLDEFQR